MQASLNKEIISLCSDEISQKELSNRLSEIISKSFGLDCFAIYIGTKESVKLSGLYINQIAFLSEVDSNNKSLKSVSDHSEIFTGIRIPESLFENNFMVGNKEIKVGNFNFNSFTDNINDTFITILYGNCDKKHMNKAKKSIEDLLPLLEVAVVSYHKNKDLKTDDFVSSITLNFISNTLDIKGYMSIVIKLFQFYFNAGYGSLNVNTDIGNYFVDIGKANINNSFVLEFNLKKDDFNIKLTLSSEAVLLNTSESHLLSDLSLEYFSKIVDNFINPSPVKDFRLSNFVELMKIFEALGEGKTGLTDRLIDSSKYIGKKIHFSDSELENLTWTIALRNIGKVAIRFYFKHTNASYENEFNDNVKSNILLYILPRIGNTVYYEILKASEFFIDITSKKEKILHIHELVDSSDFDPIIKNTIGDYVIYSKKKKCYDFYKCPDYFSKLCSTYKSSLVCFETHHTMGDYKSIKSCRDCILFYKK